MSTKEDENKQFKPTFYGFTGGVRKDETMAEFIKRVNSEARESRIF